MVRVLRVAVALWCALCVACGVDALSSTRRAGGMLPPSSVPVRVHTELEGVEADLESARNAAPRRDAPSCFDGPAVAAEDQTSMLQVSESATPGAYGQFFMKLVPGVHGKLYGRSLVAPCRCEACAYVLDTLVMYLDEDTMGWFLPDDVEHVMQDRFCYGVKWIYRSACHHILSAYYEEIITMVMGHLTGVDMCRVLRFCPFHFSSGNWMWPQHNPLSDASAQE